MAGGKRAKEVSWATTGANGLNIDYFSQKLSNMKYFGLKKNWPGVHIAPPVLDKFQIFH
jgi:hypothetical protein